MPQAQASIVINGNIDQIFAISNDIGRWPELFKEYRGAKILSFERNGRFARIEFELTNEEGETWQSWRILDYEKHEAIAQRGTPKFPFYYMHLTWNYEPVEDGVRMTWTQAFEMDPKAPVTNEQVLGRMTAHMESNQAHFKQILESMPEVQTPLAQSPSATTIEAGQSICTMINTLTVKPENQQAAIDYLKEMTEEVVIPAPGFISANFHLSKDGTRVINYAQWQTLEDLQRMLRENPHHVKRMQELTENIEIRTDLDVVYTAHSSEQHS